MKLWKSSQALLFDKDGTIIDFNLKWLNWCRIIVSFVYKKYPSIENIETAIQVWGVNLESGYVTPNGFLATGSTKDLLESLSAKIAHQVNSNLKAQQIIGEAMQNANQASSNRELVQAIPRVSEVIKELYSRGYKLAVVTTDDSTEANRDMEILNLAQYFEVILGCDLVKNCKPSPDLILEVCRQLNIKPTEVSVIGDTTADMSMGESAGVACLIGVASGVTEKKDLLPKADIVLDSVGYLLNN